MKLPVHFELALTPESLARWQIGRDGIRLGSPKAGDAVPLPYLVFLRAQPLIGTSFHEILDRDPDRGLYGGVNYRLLAPLRVGMSLQVTSDVQTRRTVESPRGALTITTLLSTYRCDGAVCATEAVRMVDLPAGAPAVTPPAASSQSALAALTTIPPVTRNQVAWLTVETGDMNPLHLDPPYARARGFKDVVVPATLITALIERELAGAFAEQQAIGGLEVRYHAPTFPDEAIQLFASSVESPLTFEAYAAGTLRASGNVQLGMVAG